MSEDREQNTGQDREQNVGDVEGHALIGQNIGANTGEPADQNIGANIGEPTDQNIG